MKQIYLSPSGQIKLKEVQTPVCKDNGILVKTEYSLVSTGTEFSVISQRRSCNANDIGEDIPLGYSNAGVVIKVGNSVGKEIKVGDRVACAGGGHATHGEICYVPRNLFVKLPDNVSTADGAFNALGAVAMHGFRRGEACLGDWVAVIGLGMIGLITVQYAKLAGCKVIAIDLMEERLNMAKNYGAEYCFNAKQDNMVKKVIEITGGKGVDVALLCAGSPNSSKPLCSAIDMSKEKGKVVMVGNIKLDFPRDNLYNKEVDLLISRSYGPGRYDLSYEEEGQDYPYGYVRWTENRNMEEFIHLVSRGSLNVKNLVTATYPIGEELYEANLVSSSKPMALMFKY